MALDKVALILKRGDNGDYRDGMIIDIVREADWGLPLDKLISPYLSKVYLPVIIDKNNFIDGDKLTDPVYNGTDTMHPLHLRKYMVDYDELGGRMGIPDLKTRVHTADSLGVLDGSTKIDQTDLFDVRTGLPSESVQDLMAISQGSYTIGAGGGYDYLTIAQWGADIGGLTGNLTGTLQTAVTETAQTSINVGLASKTLTLTSALNHFGNFAGGYLITHQKTGAHLILITCSSVAAGAIIAINKLNFKTTGINAVTPYATIIFGYNTANILGKVNDVIIDCDGKGHSGIYYGNTTCNANAFNIKVVNADIAIAEPYGVGSESTAVGSVFENITIYGMDTGFNNPLNTAYTAKNIAAFNCPTACYKSGGAPGLGATSASKCASDDATGSEAGLRNLVAANEFISTTLADGATYLAPISTGVLYNSGAAVSIAANTYGVENNPRPHGAVYSIGANEIDSAPTVTGVVPNNGTTAGGTAVTITGTNFAAGATVTFGGAAAAAIVVVNDTTITCTTPAGAAGAANVVVTNADAQAGTGVGVFTYVAPVPPAPTPTPTPTPTPSGTTAQDYYKIVNAHYAGINAILQKEVFNVRLGKRSKRR